MNNFTIDTYEIKRKILNFSNKLTLETGKVQTKFIQDMIYGIAKSKSILLSNISEALMEPTKKTNIIKRISANLTKNIDLSANKYYQQEINKHLGNAPVVLVDDR